MSDTRLDARSALAATLDRSWPGLRVHEHVNASIASIAAWRGQAGEVRRRLRERSGLVLPATPLRVAGEDTGHATALAWSGHEQWLASAACDDLAVTLASELAGCAAVTDQTGAWVELRVRGPRALEVLERLCPVDLHPLLFSTGSVARTTMEHVQVLIASIDGHPEFTLLTPSSSARSFVEALTHAAESVCGGSGPAGRAEGETLSSERG